MKKITLLAMSLVVALTVKAQGGTDVTNLLTNPDFENDANGWTIVGGNKIAATAANYGYNGTKFIENWVAAPSTLTDQSWYQTIEVPNGVYVVRSLAHAILQSDASVVPSGVSIYANNDEVAVTTTNTNPPTEYSVATVVVDGKLTVGYRILKCNINWTAWDNVRLMQYTGETVEEAKLAWVLDDLATMAEAAMSLIEDHMQAALVTAIEEKVSAIDAVTTYDEGAVLLEEIKALMDDAEKSIEAYTNLGEAISAAEAELERDFDMGIEEFEAAIAAAQATYDEALGDLEAVEAAIVKLNDDVFVFQMLNADGTTPFDVTDRFMTNPSLRKGNQGWSGSAPGLEFEVMEFYNCDFDMYQTLSDIPNGKYIVKLQGFYRTGGNDGGAAYQAGTENISAELYANQASMPLTSLYKYPASEMGVTNNQVLNDYVNMRVAVNEAFNLTHEAENAEGDIVTKGYYDDNELTVVVQDGTLKIGLRNSGHADASWCAFRDFKLIYYGNFPGLNLLALIQDIQNYLDENYDLIPAGIYIEMDELASDAEDYTDAELSEEEVLPVYNALDSAWTRALEGIKLMDELAALVGEVENLLNMENLYPGESELWEAYALPAEYVSAPSDFEDLTYEVIEQSIEDLQAAIITYKFSQNFTREEPADYTFLVALPDFHNVKNYTIPTPWVVANVQASGDVWVGPGQPDAAGDGTTNLPCLNSWSDNFTTMDVHQDIEGLPNGVYTVSAQAITQGLGQQHTYATSSVGTAVSPEMTIVGWDSYEWERLTTDYVVVLDGKLRIGFASASAGGVNGWYQVTGFKLYYHGEATDEDLQAAWEQSLARANEVAGVLLPGDADEIKKAIEAASAIAAEGQYSAACEALNPAVNASDSIYQVTKKFMEGNYAALTDFAGEDVSENVLAHVGAALDLVDALIKAEDAKSEILAAIDTKLAAYVDYISYLIEAELLLEDENLFEKTYVDIVKNRIALNFEDLKAELLNAADVEDLLRKLKLDVNAMQISEYIYYIEEGDVTQQLIQNPDIEMDENATGWTFVKGTSNNGPTNSGEHYDSRTPSNRYLDSWNPTAGKNNVTFYQEIIGLPNGVYQMICAARTDGDNAYIFAATDKLEAGIDTAQWAQTTQWAAIKNYGAFKGEIWYADTMLVVEDPTYEGPYAYARNGEGYGWSYDTINVEVTNRYLAIGMSVDSALTKKGLFTGTWLGADDFTLELIEMKDEGKWELPTGIENVDAAPAVIVRDGAILGRNGAVVTVYTVDGKRVAATGLNRGVYVVRCENKLMKVVVR